LPFLDAGVERARFLMSRATRFPLHLPVRYRADQGRWCRGTTVNISRTGLLLRAEEAVELSAELEMIVDLPPIRRGELPPQIVCRGRAVRLVEPLHPASPPEFAATITHHRLCRGVPAERVGRADRAAAAGAGYFSLGSSR
jgi:hypothetical protein